jgi:PPP family 3-phenylpropionic acid transporter
MDESLELDDRNVSLKFGLNYFTLFAIYGISSPYLQLMVRRLGYSPASVGLFLGFFELIGITGPIYLAQIADRFGRLRPFLFASTAMILAGLGLLVPFRVPFVTLLSLALLSLGIKTPVPVLDTALLRAIEVASKGGKRAPNYGLLRAIGSVGFVIVAITAQSIPGFDVSPTGTMALAMGILVFFFFAGLFLLPEVGSAQPRGGRLSLSFTWIDSTYLLGLGVIALGRFAMAPIGSFFSMYLIEELHWHAVGAMSALAATCEIPFIVLSWKFIKKKSPMLAVAIASGAIVLRLFIYALFPSSTGAIAGQVLHSLCYGLFQPAALTFINLKTPPANRTTGMALYMGIGVGLPTFLGSALGGVVVETFGYRWLFASYTLFAAASLALFWKFRARLIAVR